MPEDFDPAWEYRQDDPEILYAMFSHCNLHNDMAALNAVLDGRLFDAGLQGLRFGRGNPDNYEAKHSHEPAPKLKHETRRTTGGPVYQCHAADTNSGKQRLLPLPARKCECEECSVDFVPRKKSQRFHSVACRNKVNGRKPKKTHVDLVLLKSLYIAGWRLEDIAAELSISEYYLRRLMKRVEMPRRKPGWHPSYRLVKDTNHKEHGNEQEHNAG